MGGIDFSTKSYGKTPEQAFNAAYEQACYEFGHGGYTGSIAEKPGFEFIVEGVQTREEAQRLVDEKSWENDKWGDCFALEIESDKEGLRCFVFFGCASC